MIVLRTIPEIPAVAAILDSVFRVNSCKIDFIGNSVITEVSSSYITNNDPMRYGQITPLSRPVSFAEVAPLLTPEEVTGFIAVIRNCVALSMGVTIDKVPPDIFA